MHTSAPETLLFRQEWSPKCDWNKHLFWKHPSVHSFRLSSKSSNMHAKSCSLLILPTPFSTWCSLRIHTTDLHSCPEELVCVSKSVIHTKWALNPYILPSGCVTERKCTHDNRRGEGKKQKCRNFPCSFDVFCTRNTARNLLQLSTQEAKAYIFNVLFISAFSGSKGKKLSKCYSPRKFRLFLIVLPFLI